MVKWTQKIAMMAVALLLGVTSLHGTNRALVIGIGDYPAASGWAKIHGDKDVDPVVQMLVSNGYARNNITILKNAQATREGIVRAFENLIASAQTGDPIYIHFSGHGQQVTDVHGDEADGLDEAWVPYDAAFAYSPSYRGQNHLLDDDLNAYLRRLRSRIGANASLIVIVDACHSGGGTRALDEDDYIVRGQPVDSLRGGDGIFRIPGTHRAYESRLENPIAWVQISACRANQCNYEYNGAGSLTYALLQVGTALRELSCDELLKRVKTTIRQIIPFPQIPQMDMPEGHGTKRFLTF